ncbi:DUF3801 domain-containing protein [Streptococcus equi subsp. zooepidemicus]|uniref:Conjugative transposon protein n=1 Tax=Streptococcus suis TaxID=1307 RepID=A0A116MXF3_STRSU|nr:MULTISPECIES: DUF3801 domain-containing protein [Streptococcus]MCD3432491.1 DUF3801 domain-containing protein [Streptococcus equi subsp. zooepidemicus]NQG69575.1 DUF3801 domain-containing protein [Streptococcus suis]NQI72355.1 DUF3801 domain-containing protein [Streptococcus suis]CYV70911.1 Uncharacterised protein [Streptococcus suis]
MEQDRMLYQITNVSKITGELVLKALWAMTQHMYEKHQYNQNNQSFTGETNYNKFMATNTDKEFKNLNVTEAHLDKLKNYLESYGIGFTTRKTKGQEGQDLIFEVKNKAIVERSMEKALQDMTRNPKKVADQIAKKPGDRSISEKIAYFKNHFKYKGISSPSKGKGKTKGV